jgi:hypothetical protein
MPPGLAELAYLAGVVGGFGAAAPPAAGFGAFACREARMAAVMSIDGAA